MGKAFGPNGVGYNCFFDDSRCIRLSKHCFDYGIADSTLSKKTRPLLAVLLRYANHQRVATSGWKSILWRSMVDEVRMVNCINGECVLLGLGSMAWSGGVWNASPFVLWRERDH